MQSRKILSNLSRIINNHSKLNVINNGKGKSSICNYCIQSSKTFNDADSNWEQIYRLPQIHWIAAFNRLKVYQAGVTALGVPAVLVLEQAGQLAADSVYVFAAVGMTGFLTLTLASLASKNLIGLVYMNESADKIKMSFVDFWGRRKNVEMLIDEIIPPSEAISRKLSFYQPITFANPSADKLKLLYRFGQVLDGDKFALTFGDDLL